MALDLFGNPSPAAANIDYSETEEYIEPLAVKTNEPIDDMPAKRPTGAFLLLLSLSALILVGQLARIQIISFPYYQNLASGNSVRIEMETASRGLILDRNQQPLATNTNKNALVVKLAELPRSKTEREALYQQMQAVIDLTDQEINEIESVRQIDTGEIVLRSKIDHETMLLLKEKLANLPAFAIEQKSARSYDSAAGLAHLLGYMGRVTTEELETGLLPSEEVGRLGLEKKYEKELKGVMGRKTIEVDANGKIVRVIASPENSDSQAGYNLTLNLDINLQKEVTKYLEEAIEQRKKSFGDDPSLGATAIVLDPRSGAVLSLATLPSFDNNQFATGISAEDYQKLQTDPAHPLLNHAIAAQLPSGSVIKPVIASAALDAGFISPNFTIDTPPAIQIGDFTFPDWKDHGTTDIRRAIAESNNIFFYALGGGFEDKMRGLGIERLDEYFTRFGFSQETGVDLIGEKTGFIPTPDWKKEKKGERWYIGDTYHFAIGQGDFLTTPIQLAAATVAIANGGTLYQPQLAQALLDSNNQEVKKIEPKIKNKDFISGSALAVVREGMRQAVEYGSARKLNSIKVPIAGKTGTAQYGNQDRTHAWFTSFAPYENPELVVLVVIEGGGGGHEAALPVAEKIYRYYYNDPAPVQTPEVPAEPSDLPEPNILNQPTETPVEVPVETPPTDQPSP